MTNKIGVSVVWLERLENLARAVKDPAAQELLLEILVDLYEINMGDCE